MEGQEYMVYLNTRSRKKEAQFATACGESLVGSSSKAKTSREPAKTIKRVNNKKANIQKVPTSKSNKRKRNIRKEGVASKKRKLYSATDEDNQQPNHNHFDSSSGDASLSRAGSPVDEGSEDDSSENDLPPPKQKKEPEELLKELPEVASKNLQFFWKGDAKKDKKNEEVNENSILEDQNYLNDASTEEGIADSLSDIAHREGGTVNTNSSKGAEHKYGKDYSIKIKLSHVGAIDEKGNPNHYNFGLEQSIIDNYKSSQRVTAQTPLSLTNITNSPPRKRSGMSYPRSSSKENSPKKRRYSTISQSCSFTSPNPGTGVIPISHLAEKSTNDSEISSLVKHNSRQTSTPRKRNSDGPDFGNISAIKSQRLMSKRKIIQSQEKNPIKPDELSKKERKLNDSKGKKLAKGQACFADEDDSGLGSSLTNSKILENDQELGEFLKKCKEVGKIAIHCHYEDKELSKVFLSYSKKDEVYYIGEKFNQNELEEINRLLSSGKVKKVIVYDIKEVKKTLPGIEKILDSVDDLKVMSYSLDTKKHDNSLSSIFEHNFDAMEETFSAKTLIKIHNKLESRLSKQEELRKIYDNYDKPLTEVTLNMGKKGVRVDVERLEELDKALDSKIKTLEKEIYKLAGGKRFEIRSPKRLRSVLFNKMKLQHETGLDNLSGTDSKTLRELERRGAEIAGKVLRWRSLDKLKSGVKGCIDKVDEHDGRIHADFLTTKTGRLSLKDPNLQSIPNRDKEARFIRQAFIAEEGHKLISADYSQMELRILAEIANVKKLKEAFDKGEDIHAITAKQIFGREDGEFRQKAKAINFGIIYGMSEYQLAKELKVSTQEAKTYIEKYYKEYPEIKEYKRNTVVCGRVNHYVETVSGRRINTEYISSRIIPVKEYYRRAAVNARIQGTGADMIRLAMIKLSKELKEIR